MAYYLHETPGRLRLRTPELKGQKANAARLAHCLDGLTGIKRYKINPATGSVLIEFKSDALCHARLIRLLSRENLISGVVPFPRRGLMLGKRQHRPRTRAFMAPGSSLRSLIPLSSSPQKWNWDHPTGILAKKALTGAAKIVLPILAERAFGKIGRDVVSAFL